MEILIIGGVAAGATAAARARRLDESAKITLLEAGADVSFANCGLPYYLGGDIEHRSSLILQSPQSFHDQYRVDVHTETQALEIDRKNKKVIALDKVRDQKVEFSYDKLILAQGGKPIVPPIPGAERDHVFQLWTLEDMDRIDHFIKDQEPKTALVVGGGFIGLEMVEALAKRGLKVSLVERFPQVMPNLEGEIAGFLTQELVAHGVAIHTGDSLTEIQEEKVLLESGTTLSADLVLLSIGVKPTLTMAQEAGLELGEAGGLLVGADLRTSDPDVFAAGDMVEINHRVLGKKLRIPLAGPANRQGRIAATNALGGSMEYGGSMGTSIVKVFEAQAASTGMSIKAAKAAGFEAEAVVVHKHNHTSYFPGATKVTLMVIYEKSSGKILGAQATGLDGVDKRIDVLATAILGGLTVDQLAEIDLAYAPPFNGPNGPVHMASFTAGNRKNGYSPSITAAEMDDFVSQGPLFIVDVRDPISYDKARVQGSINVSVNHLRSKKDQLPTDRRILIIDEDGQKGHVAVRQLVGAGFSQVFNLSGGYLSLERLERALGLNNLEVGLYEVEEKSLAKEEAINSDDSKEEDEEVTGNEPIIVDVRTPGETAFGMYPGAINIPLDSLPSKAGELGSAEREITLYCASGARSAYGQRLLMQMGFTNVRNGGGLADMMAQS